VQNFEVTVRPDAVNDTIAVHPPGRSRRVHRVHIPIVPKSQPGKWIGPVPILTGGCAAAPAMMAAIGAALMLITHTRNPRLVYDEVDWGLLVFFVGLFLIVGGAENSGLTRYLFDIAERSNLQNAAIFTAVTAVLSNLVSNVPAVMLLKTLVPAFHNPHTGWLVLAMASTLAGNLTITGSVANLIVVERAHGEVHIGFWDYSRVGIPVTLVTLAVGWAWLAWVR